MTSNHIFYQSLFIADIILMIFYELEICSKEFFVRIITESIIAVFSLVFKCNGLKLCYVHAIEVENMYQLTLHQVPEIEKIINLCRERDSNLIEFMKFILQIINLFHRRFGHEKSKKEQKLLCNKLLIN